MPDSQIPFVLVPSSRLSTDALHGLVDEFVSREGTEYGERDVSLEEKRDDVLRQIQSKRVVIVFDTHSESCNIVTQEEFSRLKALARQANSQS